MNEKLRNRYQQTLQKIEDACKKAGRSRDEVTLVAVSKFHSPEAIEALINLGQRDFGENYLQEVQAKQQWFSDKPQSEQLNWHFIGHLQSRKARHAAGNFSLIQTLDSEKLANELQKTLVRENLFQKVLIEVNIAGEKQKSGISENDLPELAEKVLETCPNLQICGLMCMAPVARAADQSRKYFSRLRELNEQLKNRLELPMPYLSMGMSQDFGVAIEEGATIVRIGTAIFGPRILKAE